MLIIGRPYQNQRGIRDRSQNGRFPSNTAADGGKGLPPFEIHHTDPFRIPPSARPVLVGPTGLVFGTADNLYWH